MHNEYDKIEVLDGLSGVRAKLAMYIGGTGVGEDGTPPRALIQMLQETISNSLDEAISGYGNEIVVTVHDDNSVSVCDHGRGIPAGDDLQDAINAFTKTHASGKFSAGAYTTGTTGMHGIGMKAVNAASSFMRVESIREDGSAFLLEFECGELTLKRYGDVIREELSDKIGPHGTLITFMPDTGPVSDTITKPVLESNEWDIDEVKSRCEIAAFLTPGVTITLNAREESTQWCYPGGLDEWFSEGRETVSVAGTANVDGHEIQVELVVSDGSGSIVSFANGVATKDGGYHEAGLRASLPAAFSTFANRKFVSADVLSALDMAVHVKVPADIIEFEGQTKEKLGTSRARQAVSDIVKGKFVDALFDNSSFAKKLIESIDAAKSDREAIVKARELAKKAREATRGVDRLSVSSKLKTASSRNPAEKELIITEGDSASGIGRDPKTQAIMPLRGKIKNVYEIPLAEALSNKEVSTLISVLGAGVSKDFDPKKSQYGRVLIACFTGDTTVRLVDGKTKTFRELVDSNEEIWVWSRTKDGRIVPAKSTGAFKTRTSDDLVEITLDNDDTFTCTADHMIMLSDGQFVRADELDENDSLSPIYFDEENGRQMVFDEDSGQFKFAYRIIAEELFDRERHDAMDRLAEEIDSGQIESHQRSVQVHHLDGDKKNDCPSNLEWLTASEHFRRHNELGWTCYNIGDKHRERVRELHHQGHYADYTWADTYNGSPKHIEDVKRAHREGRYKHCSFNARGYNGSEQNRETARRTNRLSHHRESVKDGKILNTVAYLLQTGRVIDETTFDFHRQKGCMTFERALERFESVEEMIQLAADRVGAIDVDSWRPCREYSHYDNNRKQRTQIARVIRKMIDEDRPLTIDEYQSSKGSRTMSIQTAIDRGLFESFDEIIEYAKHVNHSVKSIRRLDSTEDVYCLRVPEYGNFALGCGVFVKNCDQDSDGFHIRTLLLGMFFKLCPGLIENGMLYVVQSPLYKAIKYVNGQQHSIMIYSESEMVDRRNELAGYEIRRFKGLGEMSPEESHAAIADKETRHLTKITVDDARHASTVLKRLLGNDLDGRKQWLAQEVRF